MSQVVVNIGRVVDRLGEVKAQIATLETKEKALRDELAACGMESVDGKLFRATVSIAEVVNIKWKDVVAALPQTPSLKRLVNRHTETVERTTVKVTSR